MGPFISCRKIADIKTNKFPKNTLYELKVVEKVEHFLEMNELNQEQKKNALMT